MPLIPFIEQTVKTANAPAPVLDRNRRPTVDNSGVVNAIGRMGKAAQQPLIDADPFVAKDRALSNAGRAVAEAGGVLQAVAVQKAKAKDYTDITTAKARMDDASTEFEIWKQKNPDPSTWGEGWNKHFAEVSKSVMADPNLSARARTEIGTLAMVTGRRDGLRVELDATKTIGQRAEATASVSADQAYNRGDREAGDAILADAVESGFMMADRAHSFMKAGEQVVKKREEDAVYGQNYAAILADADGWVEANKGNKNGLDPKMHNSLDAQARQQQNANTTAIAADFADKMVTDNAIKTVDDIDGMLAGQRPSFIAKAKAAWREGQSDKFKAYNNSEEGVRVNTGASYAAIDAFDAAAPNAKENRIQLEWSIRQRLPAGVAGEVIKDLDAKFNPPKTPSNPTAASFIRKQVSAWYQDGKFGAVKRPVREGEKGFIEDTFKFFGANEPATQDTFVSVDPADRDRAMATRGQVEMDSMEWLKKNPNASMQEAQKALGTIVRDKLKPADIDTLMRAPMPAAPAAGRTATDILNGFKTSEVRGFVPADTLKDTLPEGLKAHAQDYIDAARETGLNPKVLAAISALETAGGTSSAFRNKRNAMGISDSSGPVEQVSVRESIFRQARTLARADGPYAGAKTIEEIGAIYAPPGASNDPKGTNGTWSKGVRSWLGRI